MKSPYLILMVGPPGSGKSTKAHNLIYNDGDMGAETEYVNQDKQGKDGHMEVFNKALHFKNNIIVDRMNFSKEQRERYIAPARAAGYQIEIMVFHVPFNTCMERCLKRENHETIKTQEDASRAINFFFSKYEKVEDSEADIVVRDYMNISKSDAVIFDIDGTLADISHRLHYVRGDGKKDWKSFFRNVKDDKLHLWCNDLINAFKDTHEIVLASGRPDDIKRDTVEWLKANDVYHNALHMRKRGDFRQDFIIKQIILDFELKPRYNIKFCVDDRKQVIDMYRQNGLIVLDCAGEKGNF